MTHRTFVRWRTVFAAATSLTLASVGLAACGGDEPQLRVLHNWTGSEGKAFQAVINQFEKDNPDIKVKAEQVPIEETQTQLTTQFGKGAPPDASVALPGIIRTLSENDLLMDLDDLWDDWVADGAYTENLRDVAQGVDESTEAVYFKGNVNGLIWHDPKALSDKSIETPTTWQEFLDAADTAKSDGTPPFAVGGKDGWPLTQWVDPVMLRVAGPETFNKLARGEIGWDDPKVVESIEVVAKLMADYFPDNALAATFADATCSRADGDYLFQNQGAFVNLIVPTDCDKNVKPGDDLSFFPMPAYDESVPTAQAVSGDLFVGAKNSQRPEDTKKLLKYLGSAKAQSIWAERGGFIAPNAKVDRSVYPNEVDQRAADLWPSDDKTAVGYDLDDWIGGEIQATYVKALTELVRNGDVDAFIQEMVEVDTRSGD